MVNLKCECVHVTCNGGKRTWFVWSMWILCRKREESEEVLNSTPCHSYPGCVVPCLESLKIVYVTDWRVDPLPTPTLRH